MSQEPIQAIAAKISRSHIFADYEQAFVAASGMPLRFVPVGVPAGTPPPSMPSLREHSVENPFCALISKNDDACRMCLAVDSKLKDHVGTEAKTEVCLAGLVDTAVPVVLGEKVIGYLRTGQVALSTPKKKDFTKLAKSLLDWGLKTDLSQLEEAWFHSKVLKPEQYEAFVQLLKVFGRHLSLAAEKIATEQEAGESPVIRKAREYIEAHQEDELSVDDVAKVVNMSTFYFCKVFKKATGLTFTAYLSAVRVGKAKNLLMNPHARISEVAFQAGFQSITHFNRVFRKLTGQSPTVFRATASKDE
ncbi:MAG: helix-turn-helix domain-containing protein [Verrucomicrobiota bacterium]